MVKKISILMVFTLLALGLFSCKPKTKPAPNPDSNQNEQTPKPGPNPLPNPNPGPIKPKKLDRGMLNVVAASMYVKNLDKFLGKPIDEVDPDDFVFSFRETFGWKDTDFKLIKPKFEDHNEEIIINYKIAHKDLLSSPKVLRVSGFKKSTQPALDPEDNEESLSKAFLDADLKLIKESKQMYLADLTIADFQLINVDDKYTKNLVIELNKNYLENSVTVIYFLKAEHEVSKRKVKTFANFKQADTETVKSEFLKVNPIDSFINKSIFDYSKALKLKYSNADFNYNVVNFLATEHKNSVEISLQGNFKNLNFSYTITVSLNVNSDEYTIKNGNISELKPRLDELGIAKYALITKINMGEIKANQIFSKLVLTLNNSTAVDLLKDSVYLLTITASPSKKGVLKLSITVKKEFKTLLYQNNAYSEKTEKSVVFTQNYIYNFNE